VHRIIAAPAKERGGAAAEVFSSHEHRGAGKRPQTLTCAADHIWPGKGIDSCSKPSSPWNQRVDWPVPGHVPPKSGSFS